MFHLANIRKGYRVIDPSSGDGSFLRGAPAGLDLHACEIDPQYASAASALVDRDRFVSGDALSCLRHLWGTFDLVIGNPPFSAQSGLIRDRKLLAEYELGAGRRSQCLEILFLELFCKLARPGGTIAVILPDGPLGNGPFRYVREWLLKRTRIEAIVSLPRSTFAKTSAKTHILFARVLGPCGDFRPEPTCLLKCDNLSELRQLTLPEWTRSEPGWRSVLLENETDWRPEAHPCGPLALSSEGTRRLGDYFRIRTGYAKYGADRRLIDDPGPDRIPLIRAKNLAPVGGLRLDRDLAYIERGGPMFKDRAVVQPGEVLFVRVGAGCYGRAALVHDGVVAQADDWIHVLTPITGVNAAAVVDWLNSDGGRREVTALAKGVGTLSVSKSSLAGLAIPGRCFGAG